MREIVKLGTILMLYCLAAAASLSYVYIKTAPVIEANKEAMSGESVRLEVLPGIDGGFEKQGEGTEFEYWTGFTGPGNTTGGYVFITYGEGYSSTIETMVGVDATGIITGIKILFQQETPGLGDKVIQIKRRESDPWFPRQFVGRSALENIAIVDDNGFIDAISGATITSRAVTESINSGLKKLVEVTGGKAFVESTAPIPKPKEELPVELPPDDVIAEVLPNMSGGLELKGEGTAFPYWTGYRDTGKSDIGGYAYIARGEGFSSTIETLVGVNHEGTIIGIKILFHEETEDYGDKIEKVPEGESTPWITGRFIGKSLDKPIALTEDGGEIDGISGATVTSKAVTESIDRGLRKLMEAITGKSYALPEQPEEPDVDAEEEEEESILPDFILMGVLPDMDGGYVMKETDSKLVYWEGYNDEDQKEIGGYAFVTTGKGFSSTIEILVGTDADGAIIGVTILDHEETEGYGEKLEEIREGETEPWFTSQFFGKTPSDTIALTDDGGDIDAVTEATVTSKAIIESIEDGMKKLLGVLMSWD
ncbi:FMN-binding protein [Candidatus Latescibacterota bacterium]